MLLPAAAAMLAVLVSQPAAAAAAAAAVLPAVAISCGLDTVSCSQEQSLQQHIGFCTAGNSW